MENDNPTTEYTVMPTIQWENKKPSQIFISADKAKPIRTELREMVNHEDSDVRDWARSIIEPFEICYISEEKDELGFNEWVIFTPWMCTISDGEEVQYERIKNTKVPGQNIIDKIVKEFDGKWPKWLPIPLESSGNRQWMSEDKAINVIIQKSSQEEESSLDCDLSKSMFDAARKFGMRLYNLVSGFENLLPRNQKIGNVSVEQAGASKIYENSVMYLAKNNPDLIEELINIHGQTNENLWPIFVKDSADEVIMVSKPDTKTWNSTFLCLSDGFASKKKSIWGFDITSKSFIPIVGQESNKSSFYVRYLYNADITYSHLVCKSEGGEIISRAYDQIIQNSTQEIRFSYNKYHLTDANVGYNYGWKAFFKLGIYSHFGNTAEGTKLLFDEHLPSLPNILHSLEMPKGFNAKIPVPQMRKQRANLLDMFSLNIQGNQRNNEGFARHIFRISGESSHNNYRNRDSIVEFSKIEREIYDLQHSNRDNGDVIFAKWQECVNSQSRDGKNWSLIFRVMSPSIAVLENMIATNTFTPLNLQQVYSIASLEGIKQHRFSPLNKNQSQNFQTWFAYISNDGGASKKQRLQIEIARMNRMDQAKGILNQEFMLDNDVFKDYRDHAGFYTSCEHRILGQNLLYTQSGKLDEIQEHVRGFWSASNNQNKQGGLLKLLKGACTGYGSDDAVIHFPFSYKETATKQETLFTNAMEYNRLSKMLQNDCGIEFLFDKEVNESEVFDWVFNPYSSSADWIISKLTKHARNEPEISRFVEAIWNRQSSRFPNYEPQLLQRLGVWCSGINHLDWEEYVSEKFYENMRLARENTIQTSLYSRLKDSRDADEMEAALTSASLVFSRAHDYFKPNVWKVSGLGAQSDKLYVTSNNSLFGNYYQIKEGTAPESTGYGLAQYVKWYPLSIDEYSEYKRHPINEHYRLKDNIIANWNEELTNCYQNIINAIGNNSSHKQDEDYEIDDRDLYLKYRMAMLLLGKHRNNSDDAHGEINGRQIIANMPSIQVCFEDPNYRIKFDRNVTLGPCGWDLKYDSESHSLVFRTSKRISKDLMQKKFEMLGDFLRYLHDADDSEYFSGRIKRMDIASEIGGELPENFGGYKADPLVNFEPWYNTYSADIVEPNTDFMEHLKQKKWMASDTANEVLSALVNDASTWLATPTEMGKIELQKMYQNQMNCTIPDFQMFVDSNSQLDIPLTIVRLHGSEGGGVIGVLEDNSSRSGKIGNNFTHIGNTLLVSSNAQLSGARIDGWRLVGKEDQADFLEYLDKNWENLFVKYEDCEMIAIEEVVRTKSTDEEYDSLADLWLHKLHILYIISFYRATKESEY